MRTKALVLTAAIGAIGLASATAEVYSVNVVGFVNVNLTNGWNMISCPLKATNDTIGALIPTLPDGSSLYRWDATGQQYLSALSYDTGIFGGWDDPTALINPGEGLFINCNGNATITFVGEVRQGNLTAPLSGNWNMIGSQVPQAGGVTSVLGYPANDGSSLYRWDPAGQQWMSAASYDTGIFGGWDAEPVLGIAEGFFIDRAGVSGNWARTFNVQ